ncbi:MAG TPA: DsbA family oxidoreductase [Steroidobacteraceae bacterium]|nr:DsbA family oxidoreductase [Steroidobacteraceae bacterium]
MDTQILHVGARPRPLELDFIGDLACPWSFIGKRNLARALGSLYGADARVQRWHGLPLAGMTLSGWREHLATRLPTGGDVDDAQRKLESVGRDLDIGFHFDRIATLPDTREAHRLVHLAGQDARQGELIDGIFRAFFEAGRDISNPLVLVQLASEAGVDESVRQSFTAGSLGRDEVLAEERRLRGLGVEGVPNLLLNGRVLVPGAADVPTYIKALDQALFAEGPAQERQRLLH